MEPARSTLQPDIERRIGRNLLRYQLVEQRLKMLLPLQQVTLSNDGIEALKTKAAKLRLVTLGQLLASYAEGAATTAASDVREQQLTSFLDARNWLVHHLLTDHQMLASDAECLSCIERLDRDYEAASVLASEVLQVCRLTFKVLQAFMDAWVEAGTDLSDGEHLTRALARQLTGEADVHVSITMPAASIEDILELVMKRVVQSHSDNAGWAHFNTVGHVARQETPGLPRGLLAIARQVQGFEFALRPPGKPNASWMFRSTSTPAQARNE